jgi:uncharacterized protein YneF (UPF0154 family)
MKSRLIIFLVVGAALGGGFFLGHYQARRSWDTYVQRNFVYLPESTRIAETVRALTALRAGRQSDGLQILERSLDQSLLMYWDFANVLPDHQDDFLLRSVRMARDYRAVHPFTEPLISNSNTIQQVFRLVK